MSMRKPSRSPLLMERETGDLPRLERSVIPDIPLAAAALSSEHGLMAIWEFIVGRLCWKQTRAGVLSGL